MTTPVRHLSPVHVCGIDCGWGCIIIGLTSPVVRPSAPRYRVERSVDTVEWVVLDEAGELVAEADTWADAFAVAEQFAYLATA